MILSVIFDIQEFLINYWIIFDNETFQDKWSYYNYRIRSGMYVIEIDERRDFFQKIFNQENEYG